jgi:tubulin-specific chaperone D
MSAMFTLRGVLFALCFMFKLGPRALLMDNISSVLPICTELLERSWVQSNSLLRKLVMKLTQRAGLCYLKPKLVSWRYQRGTLLLSTLLKFSFLKDN